MGLPTFRDQGKVVGPNFRWLKIGSPLVFDSVPNAREGWEHFTNEVHAAVCRFVGIAPG